MTQRVYLPTTLEALAAHLAAGEVGPAPLVAHAVTDALRAERADDSEEEREYVALRAAADDCAALWEEGTTRRRVVLAADVPAVTPDDAGATLVTLDESVPLRRVAAAHADLSPGDAEADAELCWFATQEIPDLLA